MWGLVGLTSACLAGGEAARPVGLDEVARWLGEAGYSAVVEEGRVRWACTGEDGVAALATEEGGHLLRLRTNGLVRLDEAQDSRHIVLLLTQLATSSHDVAWGGLSLEPEQGEVIYRIDLPRHDGLGAPTVHAAAEQLCAGASRLRPLLRRSASGELPR